MTVQVDIPQLPHIKRCGFYLQGRRIGSQKGPERKQLSKKQPGSDEVIFTS